MTTTVTGIIRDTQGTPLDGLVISLRRFGTVVGYLDDAIVPDERTFTTDSSGELVMAGLLPGTYSFAASVPANPQTSLTTLQTATGRIASDAPENITLEAFLDSNVDNITPAAVAQAIAAAAASAASAQTALEIAETLGTLSELEALAERGEDAEAGAVAAQALAEAALDGITLVAGSTGYQPDVATAEGALTDGDVFWTVEGDEIVQYRIVSGSAVEIEGARYPSTAALAPLFDRRSEYIGEGPVWPLLIDRENRTLLGYDAEQDRIVGSGLETLTPPELLPWPAPAPAESVHAIGYGQSNMAGWDAVSAISVTPIYNNVTFNGGVQARASSASWASLVPLAEGFGDESSQTGPDGTRETPISGLVAQFKFEQARAGIAFDEQIVLGSTAAHGGVNIASLSKGGARYDTVLMGQVTAANTLLSGCFVPALNFIQGEADANPGLETAFQDYFDRAITLQSEFEADVQAITGQTTPVPMLMAQIVREAINYPDIALAQLALAKQSDRHYLVTPLYPIPHRAMVGDPPVGGGLHLTNIGAKWIGAYFGRALSAVCQGREPTWLEPLGAFVDPSGLVVDVFFKVPTPPLVLDGVNLALATDFGFAVDAGDGPLEIASIRAMSDRVRITMSEPLSGPSEVRYGLDYLGAGLPMLVRNGASGNLRESTRDTAMVAGIPRPLWHWAPHFRIPVNIILESI
jgi:hypothetical protein